MKYQLIKMDDEGEIVSNTFIDGVGITLAKWGEISHDLAVSKGFTSVNPIEKIALMHQELSELLEELRVLPKPSKKCPSISAEAEEVADVFLRLVQYAHMRGIDMDQAVKVKHEFNIGRPHKHGKAF